ncbi:hypothetical protein SLEP1_g49940 [Rubroshorea leprosula]|uniref:Uncharacterized protein n=1 Tax=Rubroshorea leprosula TaxID=152421 RepID=A0AAV5M0X4_9ROSI|nr:hypothetical protein SLEP1_g49940 [Rubroshorea leprosula]
MTSNLNQGTRSASTVPKRICNGLRSPMASSCVWSAPASTVVSVSIFLSSGLLPWTLGFDGDQAALAAAAHKGDEVVPGGWNGLGGWRGSNESNGFGRANSQNGPKHALGPFLCPGPVEPAGPGRVLKHCLQSIKRWPLASWH